MRASIGKQVKRLVVIVTVIALLSVPASYVFGSHIFSDVPSSAYYHDSVTAVFNAGITAGCTPGKYCPNSPVTRAQMAVFLNLLGGLSLGPGGQPRTVVDALSVQGTQMARTSEHFTVPGGTATGCSISIPVRPIAADFGQYSIVVRLYATPAGIDPEDINVQIRDTDDPAPDEYQICLATLDGSPLPTSGFYSTFVTEMVFHGQNTFTN